MPTGMSQGIPGMPTGMSQGMPGMPNADAVFSKVSRQGDKLVGNAMDKLKKTPIGNALDQLKKKGLDLPTPSNLSANIVDKIFKNFSSTDKKGYIEIREDIYIKFLDTLNDHLHSPEGRQMYLRIIDPFLSNNIDEVINSGSIAIVTIIHLITNNSNIREIIEGSLTEGFTKIEKNKITPEGNLDPITGGYAFSSYVINKLITPQLTTLIENKNPLNKLYKNMQIMSYDDEIIRRKQAKDYNKSLCAKYAPIVSEPSDLISKDSSAISNSDLSIENIDKSLNTLSNIAGISANLDTKASNMPSISVSGSDASQDASKKASPDASIEPGPKESTESPPPATPPTPPNSSGGTKNKTVKNRNTPQSKNKTRYI
jgi:hypothetical protein